jgi:predicted RNA-binding protein YlxR (DUF448 family)
MSPDQVSLELPAGKKAKRGKKRKGRQRHVPQRTCVGCRKVHPKRELVRVVRTLDGTVEIDPSGKLSGRGAYLCQQESCWDKALKRGSLDHALKTTLDDDVKATLAAYAQTLPQNLETLPKALEKETMENMDGE